jgi:RimJ/RimL family protein N-acetyltransferase
MIINERSIKLQDGRELTLKSVQATHAKMFLDHLIITATESYRNLNRGPEFWKKMSVEDEEKLLTNIEKSSNSFMMGAFYEDRIVGGVGIFGLNHEFTQHSASVGMSIRNEFGGAGLGTAMLFYTIDEAKRFGVHRLELSVRTFNLAGIALYEKTGFERIGLMKDAALIDGEYVNEYSYQKILGA